MATAFWITPFTAKAAGNEDEAIFEGVQEAIRVASAGLVTLVRADDIFQAGVIIEQIRGAIERADVVIAVCTGRNANVLYELGLAEVLGHKPILIAATDDDLPFDVKHWRAQLYGGDDLPTLAGRVRRAIEDTLSARRSDPGLVVPSTDVPRVVHDPVADRSASRIGRVPLPHETYPLRVVRDEDFVAFNEYIKDISARIAKLHISTAQANERIQPSDDVLKRMADERYGLVAELLDWFTPAAEYGQTEWVQGGLRHVVGWFDRRATLSDSGYAFWIGFHKSWVVLALKAILGTALATESWSTVAELLDMQVTGQSEQDVPLMVDPSFTWPDGYGGDADVAFKDLLSFHEWMQAQGRRVEPDPISRTCGIDVLLGVARCQVDASSDNEESDLGDGPVTYAGFAAYYCDRVRWVTRRLAHDAAVAEELGIDLTALDDTMAKWWPALIRRSPQGIHRATCGSWEEATAAR